MNLAKNITIIPVRKIVGTQKITEITQKVRVAACDRVSTRSYHTSLDVFLKYGQLR